MSAELYETFAWAKASKDASFAPLTIKRNVAGDDDVMFELKYCGICHTDVHIANNDMGM
jgi:D-arabinose 1-dehydrogenase-like Zn-dependent alcohol dehydrogenase